MSDVVITDATEAISVLKGLLPEYLAAQKIKNSTVRPHFHCPFHSDGVKPNMALNPHNDNRTATCFSCGKTADIFDFAAEKEGLPTHGADFFQLTIPHLASQLGVKVSLGIPSEASRQKALLSRLMGDIAALISASPNKDYVAKRGWRLDKLITGTIDGEALVKALVSRGWEEQYITDTKLLYWSRREDDGSFSRKWLVGTDKFSIIIQDALGRPVGIISRQLDFDKSDPNGPPKYIHSQNSMLFDKSHSLFGLHFDIKKAKSEGVIVVEGPGDMAALHTAGHYNVISLMGVSLTQNHLLELKKHGIKKIIMNLDNDDAGAMAMERFIDKVLPTAPLECSIKTIPLPAKDVDEFLKAGGTYESLSLLSTFQFKLDRVAVKARGDIETIANEMVTVIGNELNAIRRSLQIKELSEYTGISSAAISVDVESYRNRDADTLRQQTVAAARQAALAIEANPNDAVSIAGELASSIQKMNSSKGKGAFGPNAQLNRFSAVQEMRALSSVDADNAQFVFKYHTYFAEAFSGGMPLTRNAFIYFGGKANHGKTAMLLSIGCDVAVNDPDSIVIIHSIDDAYERVEPRLKANIYNMKYCGEDYSVHLTMDAVNSPFKYRDDEVVMRRLNMADEAFKELLALERLVIFDGQDGRNLSFLEQALRYYRERFPNKKLLCICDNTHDYEDYPGEDSMTRMKKIATRQKQLSSEFGCALFATVEYKKSGYQDTTAALNTLLPKDDDIADSRAMTYKPDAIVHVYNDYTFRKDDATIFWTDEEGQKHPRLICLIYKNKIAAFKGEMAFNLLPGSIMMQEISAEEMRRDNKAAGDKIKEVRDASKRDYEHFQEDDGETGNNGGHYHNNNNGGRTTRWNTNKRW